MAGVAAFEIARRICLDIGDISGKRNVSCDRFLKDINTHATLCETRISRIVYLLLMIYGSSRVACNYSIIFINFLLILIVTEFLSSNEIFNFRIQIIMTDIIINTLKFIYLYHYELMSRVFDIVYYR